ncbi:MAG: hypothetical protein AAFQ07_12405, partial [Chloroflexota bacterium]
MSDKLKTDVDINISALVDGETIDAGDHTNPFLDARTQLREGQASVSANDTHVKHLQDAIKALSNGLLKVDLVNVNGNEELRIGIDATGIPSGHSIQANGADVPFWGAQGGGGAQPIDITITAGENLAERDYVYLDTSSNTWFLIDTDATPVKVGTIRAIVNASGGITSGNTGTVRLIGEISGYTGLTAGAKVYASTTLGGITQTKPTLTAGGNQIAIIELGIATSNTNIMLIGNVPVQYMKRATLADQATLTLQHHADPQAHARRIRAYLGSSGAGATIIEYPSSNQDDVLALRVRTPATYTVDRCTGGTASASSNIAAPSLAFADDGNGVSNSWVSAVVATAWLKYDFGSGVTRTIRR